MTITTEILEGVPVEDLHPNPWNPNVMDSRTYDAARESIRDYGFIDPVTVRPHRDFENGWEIIDGEHRVRAAVDEGLETLDLVVLYGLSDAQAKKLTVVLNETRGRADPPLLGRLLAELLEADDGDMVELARALRYDDVELSHLLAIGGIDWDGILRPDPEPEGGTGSVDGWSTVTCLVPDAAMVVWEQAVDVTDLDDGDEHVRNGLVLAVLVDGYLA